MSQTPVIRPPFRADHVGSLLRPAALRQAFRDVSAGRMDAAAFTAVQDDAIRVAIAMQEAVGLEVVTDGEFRRASYWGRFVERCEGFTIKPAEFKFRDDHGHEVDFTATYASGRIRRTQPLALDEYEFARGLVTTALPKVTLPAPSTMHLYRSSDFADRTVYPDIEAFFADLVEAFRQEIAALAQAGCRYIQLDEVAVALLCDPDIRATVARAGHDPDRLIAHYIKAINDCIAEVPAGMLVGVHMCRGNFKGHYLSKGGYQSVAEAFFSETNATHFLLEYDTPRAGDFDPLRFVPAPKGVVLGLVSSKSAAMESTDDLQRRIEAASRFIPIDRLGIGPQCGFASTVAGNPVTEDIQRAKLALLVETARQVWGTA